ncbi:MAG: hypothetical protein ACRDUX_31000 [Mycobacterium sp.]
MSTPRTRAGWLRGCLVGACSAVVTIAAHAAASGEMPQGAALIVALLVCATTGATAGSITLEGRRVRLVGVMLALGIAQLLGHVTLVVAGGHHHAAEGWGLTPSMFAAHMASAVVLGLAISAAEYLYVVCASLLCWLRLFATAGPRPAHLAVRRVTSAPRVESILLRSGLGMRGPPMPFVTTA